MKDFEYYLEMAQENQEVDVKIKIIKKGTFYYAKFLSGNRPKAGRIFGPDPENLGFPSKSKEDIIKKVKHAADGKDVIYKIVNE